MVIPTTTISFHNIISIDAKTPGSLSGPLVLHLHGKNNDSQITIFTGDQQLSERLAAAINGAMARPDTTDGADDGATIAMPIAGAGE